MTMSVTCSMLFCVLMCVWLLLTCCLTRNACAAPISDLEEFELLDNYGSISSITAEVGTANSEEADHQHQEVETSVRSSSTSSEEAASSASVNREMESANSRGHRESRIHKAESNPYADPDPKPEQTKLNNSVNSDGSSEHSNVVVEDEKKTGPPVARSSDILKKITEGLSWLG